MKNGKDGKRREANMMKQVLVFLCVMVLSFPVNMFSSEADSLLRQDYHTPTAIPVDTLSRPGQMHQQVLRQPGFIPRGVIVKKDSIDVATHQMLDSIIADSTAVVDLKQLSDTVMVRNQVKTFIPNPTRAVWLSALFPGLGQIYNRRYWKLPIVVGAYMGLGYATSWNNRMLSDYNNAYRDIMDTDPSTNSYMDFFPSTTKEEDLDKEWLTNTLKRRKDYFRQNRDLCIICMVGVYLLAMVDAYVDASLAQFDISPDLSMQVAPAVIPDSRNKLPSVGVQWALTF